MYETKLAINKHAQYDILMYPTHNLTYILYS